MFSFRINIHVANRGDDQFSETAQRWCKRL